MTGTKADRTAAIEAILASLPRHNTQLARLLYRQVGGPVPRGMAMLLAALDERPQRITRLAAREGLAQPTVTRMIARLEKLGLAARRPDPDDRRVVVVNITAAGKRELTLLRARYHEVLRASLAKMDDADIAALARGAEALQALIGVLRSDGPSAANPGDRG
jgi:DNA-binding MarR family transcriptional regulator